MNGLPKGVWYALALTVALTCCAFVVTHYVRRPPPTVNTTVSEKDLAEGEALYKKAVELNSVGGPVFVPERAQARELLLSAVRLGYPKAFGELGFMYLREEGGPYMPKEAVALFKKGIALGDTISMRGMGWVFRGGLPGIAPEDMDWTVKLYVRAAELGDVQAQYLAGTMLLGENWLFEPGKMKVIPYPKVDEKEGLRWLMKAVENGDSRGYEVAAVYFRRKGPPDEAEKYERKGAMMGNKTCIYDLEMRYYSSNRALSDCYKKVYRGAPEKPEVPIPNLDELCPRSLR